MEIFKNDAIEFESYQINEEVDIFNFILEKRKGEIDSQRFFLEYLPNEFYEEFDFKNPDSIRKFRKKCLTNENTLRLMGGCNLSSDSLKRNFRTTGIKMSDPERKIIGIFDLNKDSITYSPYFPFLSEERDIDKFAKEHYFTNLSFEKIMLAHLNRVSTYYLHTGDYKTAKEVARYGRYIFEKVSKEQMKDFITHSEEGKRLLKKM